MTTEKSPEPPVPDSQTLDWIDGDMPYSQEFGDHFYCREDGRAEAAHVFLDGNGLPGRWQGDSVFRIGELGFGTGLNFCETWRQRKQSPFAGTVHFVSFERFPMQGADIDRALSRWPEVDAERRALVTRWPEAPEGIVDIDFGDIRLSVVCGSAFDSIAAYDAPFDAWYLDGFAPRRNPDMWSEELMRRVFSRTVEGGTFATYAAAGFVRRNLQATGYAVDRRPGYGSKREMLCGAKTTPDVV